MNINVGLGIRFEKNLWMEIRKIKQQQQERREIKISERRQYISQLTNLPDSTNSCGVVRLHLLIGAIVFTKLN